MQEMQDKAQMSNRDVLDKDEPLATLVSKLPLTVRTADGLNNAFITTLDQLTRATEGQLLRLRNFGKKSLWNAKDILRLFDLKLDTQSKAGPKEGVSLQQGANLFSERFLTEFDASLRASHLLALKKPLRSVLVRRAGLEPAMPEGPRIYSPLQ